MTNRRLRLRNPDRRLSFLSAGDGFSILEVILALAILGGSIAVLGELASRGLHNAQVAADLAHAQLLCESKLAEITAGITFPDPVQNARFDVDRYGRVFVPDAFGFSIAVLDANANPIARFGGYGNVDSRRPGGRLSEPAIPLGWPHAVAVTGRMAYVADMVNRRLVAVALEAAAEAECVVP